MRQRNHVFQEVSYKVAQEALAGIKVGVLARKNEVSPKTIRNWVHVAQTLIGQGLAVATMLALTGVAPSTYYERRQRQIQAA